MVAHYHSQMFALMMLRGFAPSRALLEGCPATIQAQLWCGPETAKALMLIAERVPVPTCRCLHQCLCRGWRLYP